MGTVFNFVDKPSTNPSEYDILTGKGKHDYSKVKFEIYSNLTLIRDYAIALDESKYNSTINKILNNFNITPSDKIKTTQLRCKRILRQKYDKNVLGFFTHFNEKLTEMISFAKIIESHIKTLSYANIKITDNGDCNKIISILEEFKNKLSINYHTFIEKCFEFGTQLLETKNGNQYAKNKIDSTQTSELLALIKETHNKITYLVFLINCICSQFAKIGNYVSNRTKLSTIKEGTDEGDTDEEDIDGGKPKKRKRILTKRKHSKNRRYKRTRRTRA
jgi:hypothetical protein